MPGKLLRTEFLFVDLWPARINQRGKGGSVTHSRDREQGQIYIYLSLR